MNATQKILAKHAGLDQVEAGQLVTAKVDLVLGNDITAPIAIRELEKAGITKLADPNKVVLVLDHFTPNKDENSATQCKCVREFARANGVENFFDVGTMGVEHALLPEQGYVAPSELIVGADSHTCTYGALGAFSTGVGSTDMAAVMATGELWFRVPRAIRVKVTGELPRYVTGKDVALEIIRRLGVDGACYKSLEFCGNLAALPVEDRLTIANMAIECGAKNAFFPVDELTLEYLKERVTRPFDVTLPDEDATYDSELTIDLSALSPVVAFPHLPSNVKTFDEIGDVPVEQVVIGSCTNGRITDMRRAAEILRGKKIAKGVRCIVIPATPEVYRACLTEGLIEIFLDSGAIFNTPTCGPCLGGHSGVLAAGESCVSTTNRNFVGRMGHPTSKIYLASPYVAAASAIAGKLACPDGGANV